MRNLVNDSNNNTWRGHPIIEIRHQEWVYRDTGQRVRENPNRPCGHCGLPNTPEGFDGCLGEIPGAMNACCGHGREADAYVQMIKEGGSHE